MPVSSRLMDRLRQVIASAGSVPQHLPAVEVALTHASYVHEAAPQCEHNERLEFLGDAVLGLAVAEALFTRYPQLEPGEMTRLRASLVSGPALAEVAAEWQLGEDLRVGRGEAKGGGQHRPSNLSRAFEALVGAVYLDAGPVAAAALVDAALSSRLRDLAASELSGVPTSPEFDPKSALQEAAQARGSSVQYEVVDRSGPDHAPEWTVEARVEGSCCRATGPSRRAAEKDAARRLLEVLQWQRCEG